MLEHKGVSRCVVVLPDLYLGPVTRHLLFVLARLDQVVDIIDYGDVELTRGCSFSRYHSAFTGSDVILLHRPHQYVGHRGLQAGHCFPKHRDVLLFRGGLYVPHELLDHVLDFRGILGGACREFNVSVSDGPLHR